MRSCRGKKKESEEPHGKKHSLEVQELSSTS